MTIKSVWNKFTQKNQDAASLSVYEMRALTNQYEACHGDFAYLPVMNTARAEESAEANLQSSCTWNTAFAK